MVTTTAERSSKSTEKSRKCNKMSLHVHAQCKCMCMVVRFVRTYKWVMLLHIHPVANVHHICWVDKMDNYQNRYTQPSSMHVYVPPTPVSMLPDAPLLLLTLQP